MIGIIGGSGVYRFFETADEENVETTYGNVKVKRTSYGGKEIVFLARHGEKHSIAPHKINYRRNILALKKMGVERILATTAVGSMNPAFRPAEFVLPNQFIDFTKRRNYTLYDDRVVHIDLSEPYCPEMRGIVKKTAEKEGITVHEGVYVCTEGPRFETPAEIEMFQKMGADIVSMTNIPEVIFAREAEICYCTIAMVTNMAAGITKNKLTHTEVKEIMDKNIEKVYRLIKKSIEQIPEERGCSCKNALEGAV
ncbi:MAG: S-methyl-5'-thioadenosine phosphorylase [Euryarchaeota archaeon]|nr:S-methyl-5'-thioadenosine phosphorylase [Euryarchaeota archaeon]